MPWKTRTTKCSDLVFLGLYFTQIEVHASLRIKEACAKATGVRPINTLTPLLSCFTGNAAWDLPGDDRSHHHVANTRRVSNWAVTARFKQTRVASQRKMSHL